jgi:hypothetical protein
VVLVNINMSLLEDYYVNDKSKVKRIFSKDEENKGGITRI